MRAVLERVAHPDQRRVDLVFAIAMILELELEYSLSGWIPQASRLVTAVACVLFAAPIAVRRDWPRIALVFTAAVAAIQTLLGGQLLSGNLAIPSGGIGPILVLLALSYSAGAGLDARRSAETLALGLALLVACVFLPGDGGPPSGVGDIASSVFYQVLLIIPGWFVGRLAYERTRRSTAFRELAAQAAAEQAARESAAIADERARIGGELQDIIAHSVSAMVIQAGGARLLLRSDPDRARDSILNVEHTGRQALADLRRLLGMLRKDDDPRALSPQPGLAQLGTLIESVRQQGLVCELRVLGEEEDLTPGVDLVAYRFVEVVLLFALRHRISRGFVTVTHAVDTVELELSGCGSVPDLDEELRAIGQRVALYEGSMRAVGTDGDGFTVSARLPLGAAVPA
ncbi:MAG: histidine kinase [Actinomycetota bacterium]|nr:histidine kinase [Actinomycetota bacterium]